jgi:DNA sulfur modification protein DndD
MKISIDGWESAGLRCPDAKVDLRMNGQPAKVALIQMPNGTGKTTTLKLIRASLTGSAKDWNRESILELRSLRNQDIQRGLFILRLSIDDQPLVIETNIDFAEGKIRYRTSSPRLGGVEEGWSPPPAIKRFLGEKFVSLFIFDGEFAANLLNPRETKAAEAIETLCQLDLLDDIVAEANFHWDRQKKDSSGTSVPFLNNLKSQEVTLAKKLVELKIKRDEYKTELGVAEDRLEHISTQIEAKISADEGIRKERDQYTAEKNNAQVALNGALDTFIQNLRLPYKVFPGFAKHLNGFKQSLDQAKLPDTSSRQFFIDLCQQVECVCGRPIGSTERDYITKHAENYLSENISGVLNAIKSDIDGFNAEKSSVDMNLIRENLADTQSKYYEASTRLESILLRVKNLEDQDLNALMEEKTELSSKSLKLRGYMDALSAPHRSSDDEKSFSINSIEAQLKAIQNRIAEVTGTVDLRERINALVSIATTAKELAGTQLQHVLVKECNQRLLKVLSNSPLQIEGVDNHIKLKGQREGSVGQTLAVAYVFLTAALHRGSHQFPLVVDSPAGSLEQFVRKEVGTVIPELCDQFISFIIDTEREGFVPALEAAAKDSISYTTIFRLNPTSEKLIENIPATTLTIQDDSVMVTGKEFFVKFTLDEEE